jgi:hypothetical protein
MRKRTLKPLITWLLIASPLWWSSACYTFQNVIKLDNAKTAGRRIEVKTTGENTYIFDEWSVDSLGTIRGRAKWPNPNYRIQERWDPNIIIGETKYLEGPQTVFKNNIATIKAESIDGDATAVSILEALPVVAVVVGLVSIVLICHMASHLEI